MILDMTNSVNILLSLFFAVCLIYLGVEIKRSVAPAIGLAAFIVLLVVHAVQFSMYPESASLLLKCISMDFIFIFLTYIAYLWVDDIEAKARNKKSIDNSLDWFWKKI